MLSQSDLKTLKEILATKEDLRKFALKDDVLTFKDEILHEVVAMRQELGLIIGYRDQIGDHEVRLDKIEKTVRVGAWVPIF